MCCGSLLGINGAGKKENKKGQAQQIRKPVYAGGKLFTGRVGSRPGNPDR